MCSDGNQERVWWEKKKKKSLTRESRIGLHSLPICPDQNGCLGCEASELKLGVFGKQRVCHPCLKAWMPAPVQMFLLYWFAIPFFYIEWVGLDQRLCNVWSEAKCTACIKFVWATPWCKKKSMSFFICILVFIYLFIWPLSWKARRCGNKGSICVPSGLEHNLLTGYGQNVLSYLFALTAQFLLVTDIYSLWIR